MPPSERGGKAKSAKARQRRRRRQQRQQQPPVADVPEATRELGEELTELGGDSSLRTKKKNLERAVGLARVQFEESTGRSASACRHGFTPPLSEGCVQLLEACFLKVNEAGCTTQLVGEFHLLTKRKFQRVWEDGISRESIKAWAVSKGATSLQAAGGDCFIIDRRRYAFYSMLIIFVENYDPCRNKHQGDCVCLSISRRVDDIFYGGIRAAVKFFLQRAHCSCLENMYAEVKSQQDKLGRCCFCKKPTKFRKLWECTRCNAADYCSKECQVAHWPKHKETCDFLMRNNYQLVALSKPTKALTPFLNGPTRL